MTPFTQSPNILVVIVDELFVASSKYFNDLQGSGSQQSIFSGFTPTLTWLGNNSINFQQYYVSATECTPSRAVMLTGLYSPQTSMYNTQTKAAAYNLDMRFPNIGNTIQKAVSQYSGGGTPYSGKTTWIGKWQLSNQGGSGTYYNPWAESARAQSTRNESIDGR